MAAKASGMLLLGDVHPYPSTQVKRFAGGLSTAEGKKAVVLKHLSG